MCNTSDMAPSTFQELWNRAAGSYPDRPFLVFRERTGGQASWTYAQFDALVARVAGTMAAHGVGRGDAVHIALRNCPAFVLVWLAAARLGAWIVSVDPASSRKDIELQIRRTAPKLGFCAAERAQVYRSAAADLLHAVVELSETAADTLDGSGLLGHAVAAVAVAPADRLALMFTSGTTSAPKGVVLTQANYHHTSTTMSEVIGLQSQDRWFVTLPLFHANAQFYCFGPAIAAGASVGLTASFSASGWFNQAAELEVTHASLFAAPIRMILARRPHHAPKLALKHLWFAQSLGEEHYREFAEHVGVAPRQLYGMTETTAIVTGDLGAAPSHDVIGTRALDRTVRLVDPATGRWSAPGETGVITVGGVRGVDLFEGYLDDPVKTAECFTEIDGQTWFSTGDLARCDSEGIFKFVGRIDDVIKVAGENVSLTEVEAALAQAPGILEVAVLARPDPIRDQVPVAFVVPRDPACPPLAAELDLWAAEHLAPQSRPRDWTVIEELPRTSVGKIRRFKLNAMPEHERTVPEQASARAAK
ncbi:class I adenylate-forming enzyme family protein [Glutamicibacter arilaitensis]|uniref:class I adenylate-forming enzyme family protein n=1 Tax=Glutamicibacter arilaitensis TaxID=256701 RepID=UPI00384BEC39